MKHVVRFILCLFLVLWLPLIALGFASWATGIHIQVDNDQTIHSFPYRHEGIKFMTLGMYWGVLALSTLAYLTLWCNAPRKSPHAEANC